MTNPAPVAPELTQAQIDKSYEHHCVASNPYAPSRKYWGRAMQSGYDIARAALAAPVHQVRAAGPERAALIQALRSGTQADEALAAAPSPIRNG